jgi:gephyrin
MAGPVYPMLEVEAALAVVLAQAEPLAAVETPLHDALGRVLAEDVVAAEPLPPFRASIKDGYAVVAGDGPGVYPLVGEVTAGRTPDFTVQPGQVAYITTGAPLPPGADAVVMVEETERLPGENGITHIRIGRSVQVGDDIRPVGVDVAAGEQVLAAGELLGPSELGILATVGSHRVAVYPQPRVGVLSSGDELVEPGQPLGPGQIRDSNRAMLLAAVRAAGGTPVDLGIARDTLHDLEARVAEGLARTDILLTSGGVSMGDLDLIAPLLERAGKVHFGRILMKPGKPLTFATADVEGRRRLIFGLPGNPVSSMVTFYLMGVPALRKLAGWRNPALVRVQATLAHPLPLDAYRPEYHRATLRWEPTLHGGQGGYLALSTGSQSSSRLLSMRSANALLELPKGSGKLDAGVSVPALIVGPLDVGAPG